jgi:hypothetical protein
LFDIIPVPYRRYHGARIKTFNWLGIRSTPRQLVLFCNAMLVILVTGMPPIKQVNAAVIFRFGPITVPDARPPLTPGLSPFVMGTIEFMLCAGALKKITL